MAFPFYDREVFRRFSYYPYLIWLPGTWYGQACPYTKTRKVRGKWEGGVGVGANFGGIGERWTGYSGPSPLLPSVRGADLPV